MSDFDDGDSDDFSGNDDPATIADRPLGLVVPPRARLITDATTGELLYDELAAWEADFRKRGRPVLEFEEDPDGDPIRPLDRPIIRDKSEGGSQP
jgi:hypothetical protein